MISLLLNPAIIGLIALFLSIMWMMRDTRDQSRPLLVIALVVNLFYGWLLTFTMGRENSLVPWKYDDILHGIDTALGLGAAPVAAILQGGWRVPLLVLYELMVPMMIAWFLLVRSPNLKRALVLAYVVEMVAGPLLYALVPACGPIYAFRGAWLHPPAVPAELILLQGMPNAFPSLHIGTALVLVLFARGKLGKALSILFLAGTACATVATGEHYIIDLVAGLAFGSFAASAGKRKYAPAAMFLAMALCWSGAVRFGYLYLMEHVLLLRAAAALTLIATAINVVMEWRPSAALPEPDVAVQRSLEIA